MDIHRVIDDARKNVRRMKRSHPEFFPEWQRIQALERELQDLKQEINRAKLAWKRLAS